MPAALPVAALAALSLMASDPDEGIDEEEPRWEAPARHVQITAWGGGSLLLPEGIMTPWAGAEIGWIFSGSTLSAMFEGHRYGDLFQSAWTPVALLRFEQRYETRRGLEGTFTLGLGAGKPSRQWEPWFNLGVGARVRLERLFFGLEIGFEPYNFVRFAGGLGATF